MDNKETVIVLDFGGQYNQLIARRVREYNVYCEILPYTVDIEKIKAYTAVSNTDANTLTTTGLYYLTTGCTNIPSAYCILQVQSKNTTSISDDIAQYTVTTEGDQYYRVRVNGTWSSWKKLATTDSIYKTVSTGSLTSAGLYHWFIVNNLYPSIGLQTTTYVINGRNGGCYIMSCGTSDDASKIAPTITTISSGSNPLVSFNYDLTTGKVELQSNQYNTLFITQISGVRNDFTIENETNTPQLSTVGVMETMATESDIGGDGFVGQTSGVWQVIQCSGFDVNNTYLIEVRGHERYLFCLGEATPKLIKLDSDTTYSISAVYFDTSNLNLYLTRSAWASIRFTQISGLEANSKTDISVIENASYPTSGTIEVPVAELVTKSDISYKYATSVTNKQYTFNFNTPGIIVLEIIATGYSDVRTAGHWIVNCVGTFGPSCQVISDNSSSSMQSCTFSVSDTVLNMSFAEEPYCVLVKELTRA